LHSSQIRRFPFYVRKRETLQDDLRIWKEFVRLDRTVCNSTVPAIFLTDSNACCATTCSPWMANLSPRSQSPVTRKASSYSSSACDALTVRILRPSKSAAFHQIDGWLSIEEAEALYDAAVAVPECGRVVEIGSFKGRSTYALALGCKDSGVAKVVYSVDPFTGNPNEPGFFPAEFKADHDRNLDQFLKEGIVVSCVMSSAGAVLHNHKPNLVFIDGSHVYEDVLFDLTAWWRELVPEGRMAVHDSLGTHPTVADALRDFTKANNLQVELVTGSISWLRKVSK